MIELKDLTKKFPGSDYNAVNALSLTIDKGELIALVGLSGCGKTTTLKMINRLIEPTSGSIYVDSQDNINLNEVELRRKIGYVFQSIGLFPHLTIFENITLVMRLTGWSKEKIYQRFNELMELVSLSSTEFAKRYPNELSGGQQQRIGVARALALKPEVILMDEPFGALDPITRQNLQNDFRELQKKLQLTVIFVTHDMTEALLLADRIAIMDHGSIIKLGKPNDLLKEKGNNKVTEMLSMPRQQIEKLNQLISERKEK